MQPVRRHQIHRVQAALSRLPDKIQAAGVAVTYIGIFGRTLVMLEIGEV
jgi:hypothetical protein